MEQGSSNHGGMSICPFVLFFSSLVCRTLGERTALLMLMRKCCTLMTINICTTSETFSFSGYAGGPPIHSAGLGGACCGQSKSRELASNRGIAFH